jgi:hypothetical protein
MAAGDGLVIMTPTSIASAGAGSSASINADGGVDFTAVTSLSLNGVFASGFDNYIVVIRAVASSAVNLNWRYRASGTDNTANSYTVQRLDVASTGVQGSRATLTYTNSFQIDTNTGNGDVAHVYGPFLSQPTAHRIVSVYAENGAAIYDTATTHSASTSFDGFTLYTGNANTVTGNIVVFGYEE